MKVPVYMIPLYVMAAHIVLMVKTKQTVSISALTTRAAVCLTVITEISVLARQHISSALSGGCVPLQKLCDKIVHCMDASDEPPTCVYLRPEQRGHSSWPLDDINNYINHLIQQNLVIQHHCYRHWPHESGLHIWNVEYTMHSSQQRCSPSSLSPDIKFLCSIDMHMITSEHQFSLDHLCIYDHDCDDNYIYHCSDGFHLLKCKHMYCVGRFKCPSSYCISLEHICNNVCDCPHCEDESICNRLLCPGSVLTEQIGSGRRSCSTNVAILKHSMNLRQVITRKTGTLLMTFRFSYS